MSHIRAFTRSAAVMGVISLFAYGQILLAPPAPAQPFSGGLSPTVFSAAADLNGDDAVSGRDDSNAFYGDTAIIDGALDCNAWGSTPNAGTAGDGTITLADSCQLIGYDGSPDGVTITVANGLFVLADLIPIPDGTALPTVFNAADPDNPSVAEADFAWSTINGRVDANGDEAIDADDCSLGLIGETVDAGLGNPHDGADVVSTNATGVSPCEGSIGPAAADDGLVDLNSDKNITLAGDTCNNGCFLGHNVKEGVVQVADAPATVVPTSNPYSGGLSPTVFGTAADLNGDGVVNGRDDSNAFYGDSAIIDGKLDCDAWSSSNDGAAGDGTITTEDDCTLVGYDGSAEGVEITVANGLFVLADLAPIADGTPLPTVFNAGDPDNPSVAASDFAWSTIGGRVDANGDETIDEDDCSLGLIGETVDVGLGDPHDGADVLSTNATGVNPCEGLIGPAAADDGLVDLNSDRNITFSGDSCTDGCFLGHDVLEGVVQGIPTISIGDVTVNESAGTAVFTVSLSNPTQSTVTVDYATASGTATAGSDFTGTIGTVTFVAGDTSESVNVTILNDTADELDETFVVNLTDPANATIADAQAQGTIQDNDPEPSISINDVTLSEGAGTANFTVSLSAASGKTVTVNYATANGTATAGSDYTAKSGTVTFVAGDTRESVSVTILNDAAEEPGETFVVNLTGPSNATIADAQGQATIQDNDVEQTFDDVPPGHFAFESVEKLVDAGITAGCSTSPPLYCPNSKVTRGQMAVFMLRAMDHADHLPAYRGIFADVPASHPYARFIEHLYDHGVTAGCSTSPRKYCPSDSVTRGQMSVFLLRAIGHAGHLPPYRGIFADVPASHPFARYIEHLYDHGVTAGCATNPLRYCPGSAVTRAQMAIFIVKAFGL